jgi:inositol transporter-like SP family MFS transporter
MKIGKKTTTGWAATISVSMSNYIEAGSIIAIATSLSFWQKEFGISNFAVGLLAALSANAFGAAAGAIVGGPLSDRFGRKFIYTYDLLLYMLGILLAIFAFNYGMLLVGFIFTGIAVGAGVPASWTYLTEQAPPGQRAKHVGTAQLLWSTGPLIGFALAAALAPLGLLGSRIIFGELFVVAGIIWWVRQGLEEPAIWKKARTNVQGLAQRPGFRGLFSRKVNITALLFLFGVYGFWGIVAGQAGIFMPRVYAAAGVSSAVEQDLLQVVVWGFTCLATYFGFQLLADRMSRRILYTIGAALGVFAWILLAFAPPSTGVLVAFAICWGTSAGIGAQAFYGLWTGELFATPYRASAQGLLFFAARIAIGLLSFFFPVLLAAKGVPFVGIIMVVLLAIALLVGAIWSPNTRGKSLDEIETERYGQQGSSTPVPAQAEA